jgi:catechol 2,3-dioxygenase-like lactoylglutathione lyase family enzyme
MTTLRLMLSVMAASVLLAPAHAAQPGPALATRGAFFALSVADVNASARWYAEKLGLKVTLSPPKEAHGQVVVLEGGGLIVELIQTDQAMPLAKLSPPVDDPFKIHGFFKAGVIVEDYDATLATLKERGVPMAYGPFTPKEGRRNFIISDNAGNLIQFFAK